MTTESSEGDARANTTAMQERRRTLSIVHSSERRDSSAADTFSFLKDTLNKELTSQTHALRKTENGTEETSERTRSRAGSSFSLRHQMPMPLLESLNKRERKVSVDALSKDAQDKERFELATMRDPSLSIAEEPHALADAPSAAPAAARRPSATKSSFLGGLVKRLSGTRESPRTSDAKMEEVPEAAPAPAAPPPRRQPADTEMEVWVAGDDERVWVVGTVESDVRQSQALPPELIVRTADGARVKVDSSSGEVPIVNPSYERDMTSLWYLHEPGILDNLRGRLARDEPYTYVAHLLIAVNPMKRLPHPEMGALREAPSPTAIEPHPYALAEGAYRAIQLPPGVRQSQSLVVSGESGAGKTESAKMLMRYLCWRAAPHGGGGSGTAELNERIVQSNPILEALGNAKTQRNHNSSRFGKYVRIVFEGDGGELVAHSASIDTYLLEKSRLVFQTKGERNFHILYEMLAGSNDAQRAAWGIESAEACHYLSQSGVVAVQEHDDKAEFADLTAALATMSMSGETAGQMLRLLAGLLHLGDVAFDAADDETQTAPRRGGPAGLGAIGEDATGGGEGGGKGADSKVTLSAESAAALERAAGQLGLEGAALQQALTTRKMTTVAHGNAESVTVPLDAHKAAYTRDGLAKAIFAAVFDWAVGFINEQLGSGAPPSPEPLFIGILDIFGFESFAVNSLEQLLINYANEKLQATFNAHVFTTEQELYKQEGIAWRAISWPDNSGAISLISQKGAGVQPGLLHLLDEVCRLPRTTDAELNKRFHDVHAGNPHFPRPGIREVQFKFKVLHYAGEVSYTIDGFLDKNNDTVSNDVQELCCNSANGLLSAIFRQVQEVQAHKELELQKAASARHAKRGSVPALPSGGSSTCSVASLSSQSSTGAPESPRAAGAAKGESRRGSVQALAMQATEAMESASSKKVAAKRGSVAQKSFNSVGLHFMRQMTVLVNELDTTRCNFIRCIKPNYALTPGVFDAQYTVLQLRHTGMLQTCALLKNGYPTRIGYSEVKQRYLPVLPKQVTALKLSDPVLAGAILYGFEVPKPLYQLGATRVFFRAGGVSALDEMRRCDMSKRGPRFVQLVKRFLILRNWRRGLAHTRMGNALLWQLRRVRAIRAWVFAARVLRVYARGLRRLFRKVSAGRMATVIQARARAMGPRRRLLEHTAAVRAEREAKRLAEIAAREAARRAKAAATIEALARGSAQRRAYREQLRREAVVRRAELEAEMASRIQGLLRGKLARTLVARLLAEERARRQAALEAAMASKIAAAGRGVAARREYRALVAAAEAERLRIELEVKTPMALQLQRWWRVVRSDGLLRRWRVTVERYTGAHRRLVAELVEMRRVYDGGSSGGEAELTEDQKFLRADFQNRRPGGHEAAPLKRDVGRRFEMWISLKVGLGEVEEGAETTAFSGYQIFSARSAVLKKAGRYFRGFFSNAANVDENRDDEGHYLVPRSWKHFDAILDLMRDGSLVLPKAYTPSTYDNRKASTEEEELLEFLREGHFYGLKEIIDAAMPRLLTVMYSSNPPLLAHLKARGLLG